MRQCGFVIDESGRQVNYKIVSERAEHTYIEFEGKAKISVAELMDVLHHPYYIAKPETWAKISEISAAEKIKLRPIAETLAMLDGNAFFGVSPGDHEWYENYLPEAKALYEANGGDNGWAGEASFAKR